MRQILLTVSISLSLCVSGCGDSSPSPSSGVALDAGEDGVDLVVDDLADDLVADVAAPDVAPADAAGDAPEDAALDQGAAGADEWVSLSPLGEGARQENGVVALGDEVVVVGGFRGATVLSSVEAYAPSSDRWRSLAPLPARLHHPNVAVVGGRLYVLGFLTGAGFVPDGRGFVYDPGADAWSPVASMPEGTLRGASATGVLGGKVWVVGGFRGVAVSDVSAYDPATDQWEALPALPEVADHIVGGVVGEVFYAIGGRDRTISSHRASAWAYDPRVGAWEARAPMPTSRGGHAAAVWEGLIYVLGGEGNPEHASGVFDQNEVYDPATDTWAARAALKTRRHGTGAAALGGRIYLPGGADVIAFGAIDAHEAYLP